jgi:hypothetical protein
VICAEARLHIGAEPLASPAELREHLQSCSDCALFQREMGALEGNIRKALELGPPLLESRIQRRPRTRWHRWALAASILVAVLGTLAVWTLRPSDSLAHDVMAHVALEPDSWEGSAEVPETAVKEILLSAHVALDGAQDRVVYARTCEFHHHRVPHLVVKTWQGPITVLILPEEVKEARPFHEEGFTGVLAPAPRGSIAILAQGNESVARVAEELRGRLHWLPEESWPRDPWQR